MNINFLGNDSGGSKSTEIHYTYETYLRYESVRYKVSTKLEPKKTLWEICLLDPLWNYSGRTLDNSYLCQVKKKKRNLELYSVFYVEAQRKKGILDKILR